MKVNGIKLDSRGKEKVVMYDNSWSTRTVYYIPNEWKFYIKFDGEMHEVYHKSYYFSVNAD